MFVTDFPMFLFYLKACPLQWEPKKKIKTDDKLKEKLQQQQKMQFYEIKFFLMHQSYSENNN